MYNQTVKFYNVEELCAKQIEEFRTLIPQILSANVSIAALYRLLIPALFADVRKMIYLDSDTIVNLDIRELWQIEPGDKLLAVVPEYLNGIDSKNIFVLCQKNFVAPEDYFNSGVLVMNLEVLRNSAEVIREATIFLAKNDLFQFYDQNILNYGFSTQTLKLPVKYNTFAGPARSRGENFVGQKIYHYTGSSLGLDERDVFNRLWLKYFAKTPYFNEETIAHLDEGLRQTYTEQKDFATQVSALLSGRDRAFFILPGDVEFFKRVFYIKLDEEIIVADSQEALQRLIDSLTAARGRKVFFVLNRQYPAIYSILTNAGFVEGRDFLNALLFLSDVHGFRLNTNGLVKML